VTAPTPPKPPPPKPGELGFIDTEIESLGILAKYVRDNKELAAKQEAERLAKRLGKAPKPPTS
jgi:hypothetical protein